MKRLEILVVSVLVASACTFTGTATTTTDAPAGDQLTSTSTATVPTSIAAAPAATTTSIATTLAPVPDAIPIVSGPWEWERLLEIERAFHARYDGTYLVLERPEDGTVVARRDGVVILEHAPPTDEEWIVQDVELGDHWLAIVENTESTASDSSHLVVYDLSTDERVLEELWEEDDGRLPHPSISVSGGLLALARGSAAESRCVEVFDLVTPERIEEICGTATVVHVEIDGLGLAFDTTTEGCWSAWTGTVRDATDGVAEHGNRECWSNSPAGGDQVTVWFESIPSGSGGIDMMLGETSDGDVVSLGRGVRGSAEVCSKRAYWSGGNGDLRMWDGGDEIVTIYEHAGSGVWHVGCVGPWVTFSSADGIYAARTFI